MHIALCAVADYLYRYSPRQEAALNTQVLIADTDPELRQRLYARLLEIDIYSDCVNNAADALQKLDEMEYSVVIADVGLPNGGVDQVVERIAGIDPARRPIVLVLAPSAEAARTLDVEIVQIVLRRPVNLSQLIDMVRNCVRNSGGERHEPKGNGDGDGDGDGDGRLPRHQPAS